MQAIQVSKSIICVVWVASARVNETPKAMGGGKDRPPREIEELYAVKDKIPSGRS